MKKYLNKKYKFQWVLLTSFILVSLVVIFGTALMIQRARLGRPGAASDVSLSFQSSSPMLTPNATVGLMINANSKNIGFARLELTFDKSLVELSNEVQITGPLTNVVSVTSKAEANSTGKIVVVVGLSAENRNNPPTGTFEIARLSLQTTSNVTINDKSTSLNYVSGGIQIVDMTPQELTYNLSPLTLTLNPEASADGRIVLRVDNTSKYVGDVFPVDVLFSTGTSQISSLSFRVRSNYPNLNLPVEVVNASGNSSNKIVPDPTLVSSGNWAFPINTATITNGVLTVDFSAINSTTSGFASETYVNLGKIYLKVKSATTTPLGLAFDPAETIMMSKTEPVTDILGSSEGVAIEFSVDNTPPNTITSLKVNSQTYNTITLGWTAPADSGPTGNALGYEIRMNTVPITEANWGSSILDHTMSAKAAGSNESWTVDGLSAGITYYFAVKSYDANQNYSVISNVVSAGTTSPVLSGVSFKAQGVTGASSGLHKNFNVILENNQESKQYTLELQVDSSGVFRAVRDVNISDLNLATAGTEYTAYVKSESHLRKKLGPITLYRNQNMYDSNWVNRVVLAGDFDDNNKLNILDIGKILSVYTALTVPVNSTNGKYDINGDEKINIQDIALVLANYTALEILGE